MERNRNRAYKNRAEVSQKGGGEPSWAKKNQKMLAIFAAIILFAFILFLVIQEFLFP